MRLGTAAKSPAHWARGERGEFYLLVGDDDETWDVGVTLSDETFREIIKEITACL